MFLAKGSRAARLLSFGLSSTLLASASLVAATNVFAGETYLRPAGNIITLSGHGFGHGHGMSQWGAYGAATQGRSWQQILGFYYPGTRLASLGNPTIRVRLDVVSRTAMNLTTPAGLRLASPGAPVRSLPLVTAAGAPITRYRVRSRPLGGLQVEALSSAGWKLYKNTASPAVFSNPSQGNIVEVLLANGTRRAYRGSLVANRATATSIMPVSVLPMESYLRAVVPAEMPSSWHPNAVRAQAVAARSYASFDRARATVGRTWDTCDTTSCQMYSGVPAEYGASDAAVVATAGQSLTYNGKATFTQFGAANGGWSATGDTPFLVAKVDPYDGFIPNGANSWATSITVASIQARWPSIGSYQRMRIISRDGNGQWGGRVLQAAIDGSAGSVTVTGNTIRRAFGLRSEWFIPTNPRPAPTPPVVKPPVGKPPVVKPPVVKRPVALVTRTRYTAYKAVALRQGSKGPRVVFLQRALKVRVDGVFGPGTRAAVMTFQARRHIARTGIANRPVWNRLEMRDYPLLAFRGLTLRQGSRGAAVVALQRALRVTADGAFGPMTGAAVKAVQARAKLSRTGVVSGRTWIAVENRMVR